MRLVHHQFAVLAGLAAAAGTFSVAGCSRQPALVQERSAMGGAFTDTTWYRSHCVTADTLRPDFTACVLRDQSPVLQRGPLQGPNGSITRRP